MPSLNPGSAEEWAGLPVYRQVFTPEEVRETTIDLEVIRRNLPTARAARDADIGALHAGEAWGEREYLLAFFHKNRGMLRQVRGVLRYLIEKNRSEMIEIAKLLPDRLGADGRVLEYCCHSDDKKVPAAGGEYSERLVRMSEGFLGAGYIVPAINSLSEDLPNDMLKLTKEAMDWGSDLQHYMRPFGQSLTRYLITKLLREGYIHEVCASAPCKQPKEVVLLLPNAIVRND